MKIKIGNFNFLYNMENKLSDFSDFRYKDFYFWLDGKEDVLYVTNDNNFEIHKSGYDIPKYEKELKSKYKIVPIFKELTKQVNLYIEKKVEDLIRQGNYSKYELYKDFELGDFKNLTDNSQFRVSYEDQFVLDIDNNKINVGKYNLNPYTQKIDNLDDIYNQGLLDKYISNNLILKEIEKGIAPPYIYELNRINDFLQDKKNVNLIFKDYEKFKCEAIISHFLRIKDRKCEINLDYKAGLEFNRANPSKNEDDLKVKNFKEISYGKNILEIDSRVFDNIDNQIAITLEDRLKQKIDSLKQDITKEFQNYRNKIDLRYTYIPYTLQEAINLIKERENSENKMSWHNKELDQIIYKKNLIDFLEQAKTVDDIKEICVELGDNELQNIYYEMLYDEENSENEEDNEEELS